MDTHNCKSTLPCTLTYVHSFSFLLLMLASFFFFLSFFFLGKFHITAHNNWEKTTTLLPFPARLQHSKTAKVLSMCQLTTELSCYVIFQVGCLLNHCTAASVNIVLPLTVVVFVCCCFFVVVVVRWYMSCLSTDMSGAGSESLRAPLGQAGEFWEFFFTALEREQIQRDIHCSSNKFDSLCNYDKGNLYRTHLPHGVKTQGALQ